MLGTPLETISGAGRISSREAGVMCANLGSEEADRQKSLGGGCVAADELGMPFDGWKAGHFRNCFGIKEKRAAQGRRSGNHCGKT